MLGRSSNQRQIAFTRGANHLGRVTHEDTAVRDSGVRSDKRARRDDAAIADHRPVQYDRANSD